MKLIKLLTQKQKEENLTDEYFALKLGVHRMTWYRIKTGKTGISLKFLRRVLLVYPELKKEVEIFLSVNVQKVTNQ